MKKAIILSFIAVGLVMLTACGNQYDDEIDQVLKLENKKLDDSGTKTDLDSLNRDNAQIRVYKDGEAVTLTYEIREGDGPVSWIYIKSDGDWERKGNKYINKIAKEEPDYTINVDDNS